MNIRVEIKGDEQLKRFFGEFPDRANEALLSALFVEAEQIMAESRKRVPVDRGILKSLAKVEQPTLTLDGGEVVFGYYGGAGKRYARPVHDGTRTGYTPPISALEGWAARQWGDPKLAYRLQSHIRKHGTKAHPFLGAVIQARLAGMAERIAGRIKAAIG